MTNTTELPAILGLDAEEPKELWILGTISSRGKPIVSRSATNGMIALFPSEEEASKCLAVNRFLGVVPAPISEDCARGIAKSIEGCPGYAVCLWDGSVVFERYVR